MSDESRLKEILGDLLEKNEDVTARAVARALGVAPSTITRKSERARLVEQFRQNQQHLRNLLAKADKTSKGNLVSQIADRDRELEKLKRKIEVLTASHKALMLAVLEHGGIAGYWRFFEAYDGIKHELEAMGATPSDIPLRANPRNELLK